MRLGTLAPRDCYWKLARPDGYDFYTGKTINYREAIGKEVSPPGEPGTKLCGPGLIHASKNPNDCFVGAHIPCAAFLIKGRPAVKSKEKCGFHKATILEEITDLDGLFEWRCNEAANPIHPFKIERGPITPEEVALLDKWSSVWSSVGSSVESSVESSVWSSVGSSVESSVGSSVRSSVGSSVWSSVGSSVESSVWSSVGSSVESSVESSVAAYIGSLFPIWDGAYRFQPAVDLWRAGLTPSFDGKTWRLHAGPNGQIVYTRAN